MLRAALEQMIARERFLTLSKSEVGVPGGGKGALIQTDKSATLSTLNDQYLFQPVLCMATQQGGAEIMENKSPTITAAAGMSGNNQPVVCYDARGNGDGETVSTLTGDHENRITDYSSVVVEAQGINGDVAGTLDASYYKGCGLRQGTEREVVAFAVGNGQLNQISMSEVCNTLDCMHDKQAVLVGRSRPVVYYIVRRLTPTECARLQGFPDNWGHPDPKDSLSDEEWAFWQEVRNTHAGINGKAVKDYTREQMLTWYNKLHTDSAEYKMWGNGIALPCALYVMQGIEDALHDQRKEEIAACLM